MPCSDVRPGDEEFMAQLLAFWAMVGAQYCERARMVEEERWEVPEQWKEWWELHKKYDKALESE